MKWSMDTHKYMSEITRKALQIIVSNGITSESESEAIDAVERELSSAGVYKDYEGAKGRVRRALFTYFKAYGCLDSNERLTEIGRLFVENGLSIKEFSFYYILNYVYKDGDYEYYPAQLVLKCLKLIHENTPEQSYLTPYDFSKIVECNSCNEITTEFVSQLISARNEEPVEVNERSIGFDVWAKMFVQAGILRRDEDKNLVACNYNMIDWILESYEKGVVSVMGKLCTGILEHIPIVQLKNPKNDIGFYEKEGRSLQAFLFDGIDNYINEKYVYRNENSSYSDMLDALGLLHSAKGFYKQFTGVERLVGLFLAENEDVHVQNLGKIIASVELSGSELRDVSEVEFVDHDFDERNESGCNVLLYGVPGSGKSWTIEHEYRKRGTKVDRLVFHPDYTYSDFVGQILPVVTEDGQVSYEFTPGPFTKILKEAYIHPKIDYMLVIEEINRGNAPAIFGEIFQLLDRKEEKKDGDDGYPVGTSEYGVTNANIAKIVYGAPTHKVRIPSNLSIIGTMNTSDQNVFTLDTAFQRRWEMRLIENNFENVDQSLANAKIWDTEITWEVFCKEINNIIVSNNVRMSSSEDKRLGAYFVRIRDIVKDENDVSFTKEEYDALRKKEIDGVISENDNERLTVIRNTMKKNRRFPEKVIKYLWDDALKFNREVVFETNEYRSLESVIRAFVYAEGIQRFKMFKQNIIDALQNPENEDEE